MKLHCRLNRLWCILPMCAFIAAFFIGCTISRSDSVPSSSSEPLPAATPAPTPRTTDGGDRPHAHRLQLHNLLCNTDGRHTDRLGRKSARTDQLSGSLPSYEGAVVMMEDVVSRLCWGLGHIDFVFRRHTLGGGLRAVRYF